MPKKELLVEIRAAHFESKHLRGKRGDRGKIPADEKLQTPAERDALKNGNLVVIDLEPVKSKPAPEEKPKKKGKGKKAEESKPEEPEKSESEENAE